jgi:tetratricopeptide (TPR) repeat protein
MNKKIFTSALTLLIIISASGISYAQKKNVQNSYNYLKKYNPKNSVDENLEVLNEAKKNIDLAAVNPETKDNAKMHYYRGMIYMGLLEVEMQKQMKTGNLDKEMLSSYAKTLKESFKISTAPEARYKSDVEKLITSKSNQLYTLGVNAYNKKNFEMAMQMFIQSSSVSSWIDKKADDANKNTLVCLNQIVNKYTLGEEPNFEMAILIAEKVKEFMPNEVDVYITLINIHVRKNDLAGAKIYMSKALELDPENKSLHYNLGTAYMSQGQNEEAEASFVKALEIDSTYADAQYQLGAHLFNWAREVQIKSQELDYKDPKSEELLNQSKDIKRKALTVLEKYITTNPNDKQVLEILVQTHFQLGNKDKAMSYKERLNNIPE